MVQRSGLLGADLAAAAVIGRCTANVKSVWSLFICSAVAREIAEDDRHDSDTEGVAG